MDEIKVQKLEQSLLGKDMEVDFKIPAEVREIIGSATKFQYGIEDLKKYSFLKGGFNV